MLFMPPSTTYLTASILLLVASATPTLKAEARFLRPRADWQTNTVMLGGSQSYGFYLPDDGNWHDLSEFQCLDLPAYAIGPCDSPTIDQIGLLAGQSCTFIGTDGWTATLSGAVGEGFSTVGPPQRVVMGKCDD